MWQEVISGALFLGYISFTARTFIKASNPPVCTNALSSECIDPALLPGHDYALHMYATVGTPNSMFKTMGDNGKPILAPLMPQGANDLSLFVGTLHSTVGSETDCEKTVIVAGEGGQQVRKSLFNSKKVAYKPNSSSMDTSWLSRMRQSLIKLRRGTAGVSSYLQSCETYLEIPVPNAWMTNETRVNVFVIPTAIDDYTALTYQPKVEPISIMYRADKKERSKKRYLLDNYPQDVDGEYLDTPYMAIPPQVRFGPISATEPYNMTMLRALGRSHWLRMGPGKDIKYYPEMVVNSYISPRDEYVPQDPAVREFKSLKDKKAYKDVTTVKLVLAPLSWRKYSIERLLMSAMGTMENKFGSTQYEVDSIKLLFAGQSPIILLLTFVVSVLHTLFEMLSMASSWANFRETCKDAGMAQQMSARAILLDVILECLIMGWLYDEGEAKLIQILLGLKILFNMWRYYKLSGVQNADSIDDKSINFRHVLWLAFKEPMGALTRSRMGEMRGALSADDFELWSLTCLSLLTLPIFAAWAGYQVVYVPQKGWASLCLKLGAHLAYAGGFIAMTPQLYKNFFYRSVAHLPWVALTYNFLNTIIDDLFSFLIRMPKEHRISVFRDDVIFVIYWLQKWHYSKVRKDVEDAVDDKSIETVPTRKASKPSKPAGGVKSRRRSQAAPVFEK